LFLEHLEVIKDLRDGGLGRQKRPGAMWKSPPLDAGLRAYSGRTKAEDAPATVA